VGEPAPELVDLVQTTIKEQLGRDYSWPGNVRELEQAVRRILLTRQYTAGSSASREDLQAQLLEGVETGSLNADQLLAGYCALLYQRCSNYEAVARQTRLDRRTVKKYVQQKQGKKFSETGD
jgi:transcriptional regulator with GAF, ATPase, and Fis domain